MPTLRARRRRSPLVAAAACAALAVLAVLCLVLTARYARCNAARATSLSQQRAELMMQTRLRPSTAGRRHQLAVLIPYRDRPQQLDRMLRITARCLARVGADASMLVLEQAPGLHFNRGALLNAGFLLLAGSAYDCFVIHDVDTVCGPHESVSVGAALDACESPDGMLCCRDSATVMVQQGRPHGDHTQSAPAFGSAAPCTQRSELHHCFMSLQALRRRV